MASRIQAQSADSQLKLTDLKPGREARACFPYFRANPDLGCYLDSAATAQKPDTVIDSLRDVLSFSCANVHRGAYELSARATDLYDTARAKVAEFINAESTRNIVFVRGATEGINLVAYASEHLINSGDTILLSLLEHHSNIVPWQMMAKRRGAKILFTEITDSGELDVVDFKKKVEDFHPKIVAITQLANSLGTVTPIEHLVSLAKRTGARVLVDGSQGVSHIGIDVQALGADFYVFSGHKLYGPTGIGVLYGRMQALEELRPFQGGGDMISYVAVDGSGWAEIPQRFEAGTPSFPEAIALGAAIDFVNRFDRNEMHLYEESLMQALSQILKEIPGVTIHGPGVESKIRRAIMSFSVEGVHPHDLSTIADEFGVQLRAGNHCAMPTLKRLGLAATARASFGIYSVIEDLYPLREAIHKAKKIFAR